MYKGRVQQRGSPQPQPQPHQPDTQKLLELNSKLIRIETTLNFCMSKLEELEKKSAEHDFMEVRLNENADNIKLLSSKLIEFTKAIHSHLINNDKQDSVKMETCNVDNSKVQVIDSKQIYEDNFVNLDKKDQEEKKRVDKELYKKERVKKQLEEKERVKKELEEKERVKKELEEKERLKKELEEKERLKKELEEKERIMKEVEEKKRVDKNQDIEKDMEILNSLKYKLLKKVNKQ